MEDLSSRMGQMSMTDMGMTQDNLIMTALPAGGLPISKDWPDRMKLVHDHTTRSGKNILPDADVVFKICIGYTNLDTRQIQSRLGNRVCLFITSNTNMAG